MLSAVIVVDLKKKKKKKKTTSNQSDSLSHLSHVSSFLLSHSRLLPTFACLPCQVLLQALKKISFVKDPDNLYIWPGSVLSPLSPFQLHLPMYLAHLKCTSNPSMFVHCVCGKYCQQLHVFFFFINYHFLTKI